MNNKLFAMLYHLYPNSDKETINTRLNELLSHYQSLNTIDALTHENTYLITYGDSIYSENEKTFKTLHRFLKNHVGTLIRDVHILPMFPYTSDDGFSVLDYREVNLDFGSFEDLKSMSKDYRLMYDFVANHMSSQSKWFEKYLDDVYPYSEYFVTYDPNFDTSLVVRPRTSPLFHGYQTNKGIKKAWTTFSEDQVDLNIKSFEVFLELTDILLFYISKGATSIRLDAIGFLWKTSHTSCIHLPETHQVIQIWRLILDQISPNAQIITETNVPHIENISYFGNSENEANMVYQFTLPPLMLHTFVSGDASKLASWAATIEAPSKSATYFNFLASHDGIGMRPIEGILTNEEVQTVLNHIQSKGGRVSYKQNVDGTQSPYELNINYCDGLNFNDEYQYQRMILAHAFLISLVGVPAIYYHSLLGSSNDVEGMISSGINRRINREKLEYNQLVAALETNERRQVIFNAMKELLTLRQQESLFNPFNPQTVKLVDHNIVVVTRYNQQHRIDCYFNFNDTVYQNKNMYLEPYGYVFIKSNQ